MATLVQQASGAICAAFPNPATSGNTVVLAVSGSIAANPRVYLAPPGAPKALYHEILGSSLIVSAGAGCVLIVGLAEVGQTGPLSVIVEGVVSSYVEAFEIAPTGVLALEGAASASGSGNSAAPGSVALPRSSGVAFTACALAGSAAVTPPSGYTAGTGDSAALATAYNLAVSGGSAAPSFALSAGVGWASGLLAFFDCTSQEYDIAPN